jgi:hypothetical protein
MKAKSNAEKRSHSEKYIEYLTRKLASENYKKSVTEEEYEKTKAKLAKERLILKLLK